MSAREGRVGTFYRCVGVRNRGRLCWRSSRSRPGVTSGVGPNLGLIFHGCGSSAKRIVDRGSAVHGLQFRHHTKWHARAFFAISSGRVAEAHVQAHRAKGLGACLKHAPRRPAFCFYPMSSLAMSTGLDTLTMRRDKRRTRRGSCAPGKIDRSACASGRPSRMSRLISAKGDGAGSERASCIRHGRTPSATEAVPWCGAGLSRAWRVAERRAAQALRGKRDDAPECADWGSDRGARSATARRPVRARPGVAARRALSRTSETIAPVRASQKQGRGCRRYRPANLLPHREPGGG